jgi:hypothetical protein
MNRREERKERIQREKAAYKQKKALSSLWNVFKEEFMLLHAWTTLDSFDLTRFIFEIFMTRRIAIEYVHKNDVICDYSLDTSIFIPCHYFMKAKLRRLLVHPRKHDLSISECFYCTYVRPFTDVIVDPLECFMNGYSNIRIEVILVKERNRVD